MEKLHKTPYFVSLSVRLKVFDQIYLLCYHLALYNSLILYLSLENIRHYGRRTNLRVNNALQSFKEPHRGYFGPVAFVVKS